MLNPPYKLSTLLVPLASLITAGTAFAVPNIVTPPVPDDFNTKPLVTEWSTVAVGTATDAAITSFELLDAKVIADTEATAVATVLGESGTFSATGGPSISSLARWNTGAASPGNVKFLQMRASGESYLLLMAHMKNMTGTPLNSVKVAYDYSKFTQAEAATETLKGIRVYWSQTGARGSWKLVPSLSIETQGTVAAPQAVQANIVLPTALADGATMYLLWADHNSTGEDSSRHIRNFAASPGINCTITGTDPVPVRHPGADPLDPADDTVTFSTTVSGSGDIGPGWIVGSGPLTGTSGSYGAQLDYDLPISAFTGGTVTIRVQDQATADCFFEKTVTAPSFTYSVTSTLSQTITFTPSAVGDGFFNPPVTGIAEPGWSGGVTSTATTVSNVQTQPSLAASTNKYFHFTTNGTSFTTNAIDVNAIKGGILEGELELAFYSTSGTSLDAADVLNIRMELARDGNFANTAVGNIQTVNIKDVLAGEGPAFAASIAAATEYINLGTATGPAFPSTPFTFHKLSANILVPADAPSPRARIVVQTITDFANSEHLLVDNVTFSANLDPALELATTGPVTWDNHGTVATADDTFSASANITSFNITGSPGWTSNETPPRSGSYTDPNPVAFGPYPGRTAVNLQIHDQATPAVVSNTLTLAPPAATLTATLVAGSVLRNANGPGDGDDTITCQVTIAGNYGGPEFRIVSYPATVTSSSYAVTPAGNTVTLTIVPAPEHGNVELAFQDTSYPAAAAALAVAVPSTGALQYVLGQKDFGAGAADVLSDATSALPVEWINYPGIRATEMTSGGGGVAKVLLSDRIDLTGVNGAVQFSARLRAIDRTTGFEAADTFLAELIIDDDQNAPVNLITAFDTNANGVMNGADTTVPADDEFNEQELTDGGYISNFTLQHVIPDSATSVQLRVTAVNDSANETYVLENVSFSLATTPPNADSDGDGVSDASENIMGTNPNDANDVLRLTQSAGNPLQVGFPSKTGRFYRVYRSDDAAENTHLAKWVDAGLATIQGDGGNKQFDITVLPGETRRFYRLHVMTTDGATGAGDWPATLP